MSEFGRGKSKLIAEFVAVKGRTCYSFVIRDRTAERAPAHEHFEWVFSTTARIQEKRKPALGIVMSKEELVRRGSVGRTVETAGRAP